MTRGEPGGFPRVRSFPVQAFRLSAALLPVMLLGGCGLLPPAPTPAERGRRLAERTGCFACHGPEGRGGVGNPGRTDRTVPDFGDDLMMYAKDRDAVREWIEDGVPAVKEKSLTWRAERDRGALKMPAFMHRLTPGQIGDLVAFVEASAGDPEPADSLASLGLRRARALGCVGCHGAGGRLERPNPGSVRGRVPAWDGPDFPELVRNRAEFGEWVERGASRRFERNAAARFFIRRAVLKMPAYGRRLDPGDADAIWAYIGWLRAQERPGRGD
jgi:mono/diheme cytochrome c family protein